MTCLPPPAPPPITHLPANTYTAFMFVFRNIKYNLLYCFSTTSADLTIIVQNFGVPKQIAQNQTVGQGVAYWAYLPPVNSTIVVVVYGRRSCSHAVLSLCLL